MTQDPWRVPLSGMRRAVTANPESAHPQRREEAAIRAGDRQRRRFENYTVGSLYVFVVFFALMVGFTAAVGERGANGVVVLVTLGALAHAGVTCRLAYRVLNGPELPRPRAVAAGYTALTALVLAVATWSVPTDARATGMMSAPGFVAFTGALTLGLVAAARIWIPASIGTGVFAAAVGVAVGVDPLVAGFMGCGVFLMACAGAGSGALTRWTIDVLRQLQASRVASARLAVAEERLRFARDLHDVYGRTLATIGMKSQLAAELARRGDDRAVPEMEAVRALTEEALDDVRGIVRGYRDLDPLTELAGARTLLVAAGIGLRDEGVSAAAVELTPEGRAALAWLVREGVTNVLRHSDASTVTMRAAYDTAGRVRILLSNDGIRPVEPGVGDNAWAAGRTGSGLAGLAERVQQAGGVCQARREGDRHLLIAELPLAVGDRPREPRAAGAR